jgi:hypothetical protein
MSCSSTSRLCTPNKRTNASLKVYTTTSSSSGTTTTSVTSTVPSQTTGINFVTFFVDVTPGSTVLDIDITSLNVQNSVLTGTLVGVDNSVYRLLNATKTQLVFDGGVIPSGTVFVAYY